MRITERYRSIRDVPGTLPVFPLRGAIVLPRAALPLNIFEPRYLEMFNDMLAGDRLVVIVQPARAPGPTNDNEEEAETESPQSASVQLRSVGCIGRLSAFQELEDGRMVVSLTGVARCRLLEETVTRKPYRVFRIAMDKFAEDLIAGAGEQLVPRDALLEALKRFLAARNLKADWQSINRSGTEALVNSLSLMSPYGPEEKQALLEADSLKARAEMLIALAEMEIAAQGGTPGSTLQ